MHTSQHFSVKGFHFFAFTYSPVLHLLMSMPSTSEARICCRGDGWLPWRLIQQAAGCREGVSFVPAAPRSRTSAAEVVCGPRTSAAEGAKSGCGQRSHDLLQVATMSCSTADLRSIKITLSTAGTYIHSRTHTHTSRYPHTAGTHTHTHTHTYTYTHTHTHIYTYTHMHSRTHAHAHTHIHRDNHTLLARTHTHTYIIHTHTCIHAHTHTHTHTYIEITTHC